jgi:hypothetical protein
VRAPAIMVVVEVWMVVGGVVLRREVRLEKTSVSMSRKGRYLLPGIEVPFCWCFELAGSGWRIDFEDWSAGVGYRYWAFSQWLAIMATLLV